MAKIPSQMLSSTCHRWALLAVLLVVSGTFACKPQRGAAPPDEAFRSFASAVRKGDVARVRDALSARTRELLQARLHPFSDGGAPVADVQAAALTFVTGVRQAPLGDVKVIRVDGDRAVLSVTSGSREGEQRLVKEDGLWKVDLTQFLESADGGW
jgi:hypothetical protein